MVASPSESAPVTLSLFSGAGGLDLGFHQAGFNIVACVEKEEAFCKTLAANTAMYFGGSCQVLNRDIREFEPEELQTQPIEFIIGGPPCQSFSAIGRRVGGVDGINDTRGSLFEHYCRLVQHYQPKGFLFENVRGILGANKGQDWLRIIEAFAGLGYQLFYRVLDTADYGVPQHRERLILVGLEAGTFRFPRPTHGPNSKNNAPYLSALEAISSLQDPEELFHTYDGKYGHLLEQVPPGQNYHYFTKEMGHPDPVFAWRSRFSDFLYKADPNQPVRTIVAQLGKYSGPFHWKNRKFTLAEFKRLQTFPDDYLFYGGINRALQQIGNSVPPVFAYQLALTVKQQVFGAEGGIELIDDDFKMVFDKRKGNKAQQTRSLRRDDKQLSLFEFAAEKNVSHLASYPTIPDISYYHENYFLYSGFGERKPLTQKDFASDDIREKYGLQISKPETGDFVEVETNKPRVYRVHTSRQRANCFIEVSQLIQSGFSENAIILYRVNFHNPIGDGLSQIECQLFSDTGADIAVTWDAIEDAISASSSYQTMFDVYGHFTEPHPLFDLQAEILTPRPSFIVRFAKEFSDFKKTSKIFPGEFLEILTAENGNESFDLSNTAKKLRRLRFDVRVHQTNRTIPLGYFRCCYPFTLSRSRQVAIKWRDQVSEPE